MGEGVRCLSKKQVLYSCISEAPSTITSAYKSIGRDKHGLYRRLAVVKREGHYMGGGWLNYKIWSLCGVSSSVYNFDRGPSLLNHIFKFHGPPDIIVSNRDKVFVSVFCQELFTRPRTRLHFSTAYHLQTDGQMEALYKCLENYLRRMRRDRPKDWTCWLPLVEWWYNSTLHSAIQETLYEALYG